MVRGMTDVNLHEWAMALLRLPDHMVLPAVQQGRLQWLANRANGTARAVQDCGAGEIPAAREREQPEVANHTPADPDHHLRGTCSCGDCLPYRRTVSTRSGRGDTSESERKNG